MQWTKIYLVLLFCPLTLNAQENRAKYKVNKKYDHPFFHTVEWSYPWFMIKNDDGTFSSAMSDSLGNDVIDTTHQVHNAKCAIDYTYDHEINFCHAVWRNDTLTIYLEMVNASVNDHIAIKVVGSTFESRYSTVFFFRYNRSDVRWPVSEQKLVLNTSDFKKGQQLKGELDLTWEEVWIKENDPVNDRPKKLVHVKGPFQCLVE